MTNIAYTMDYWALLALSTLFCHLMASPARDLTPLMLLEDTDNMPVERGKRASVVMCSTEHSFYCINTTHYSRCMDMELMKSMKMQKVFFCGAGLCCQEYNLIG
ncbi:uncharacterized protein [Anabrus simplex]|uniref:uncharacterized protein isoform X4 n=1 Tax=Anabrus simplex TaxID=316456 RepID=UPI0035A3057E